MVCGGININYIIDNERKNNLFSKMHFPTRGQNGLSTVTGTTIFKNFVISPIINGPLDHNVQLLLIKDLNSYIKNRYYIFKGNSKKSD
jgi:hypothetical protein